MPLPKEPKREHPSTYFVEDRSNQEELNRLQILDHFTTTGMGGVLPEQPDPTAFPRVLDVGCGTGGWLIELAKTTPSCTWLVGVDASRTFVEYARTQAKAAQVSDRVKFHVADALLVLEFPNASFDLVNHRLASSWLRIWDWPKLLQEYQRVTRPGGVVRVTEPDWMDMGDCPALTRIAELFLTAFYQSGHFFTPTSDGVTSRLANLLRQHGLNDVHTRTSTLEFRAGTPEGQNLYEINRLGFQTIVPFLRKWTQVPEDYEELCQQALREMLQPDFVRMGRLLTAWGNASHLQYQPAGGHPQ